MKWNHKGKVYSQKTRKMTDEERAYLDEVLEKEREKHERDAKCGGVNETGNYIALHHRWEE